MRSTTRVTRFSFALIFSVFSLVTSAAIAEAFAGQTTRVSVSSAGVTADASVSSAVLSADGRYAVFMSSATNLRDGVVTSGLHVYRHDRTTGETLLVSVTPTGAPGNDVSRDPSVSANGQFVVFGSFASDLVDGDTNLRQDVFVRDMVTGTTRLVSGATEGVVGSPGASSLSGLSGAREISDDGRYIVFNSLATNLVAGATNGTQHVYVKDMTTGAVVRASVNDAGEPGNRPSQQPAISGDGRVVAFQSSATNFTSSPLFNSLQVFVRVLPDGPTTLETPAAAAAARRSGVPTLSVDGRYLAFESEGALDTADLDNGTPDIFLRDRVAGTTVLASLSSNAVQGAISGRPSISSDGRWVVFDSLDEQLVSGDVGGYNDVFLYDRDERKVVLVSRNDAGVQANAPSGLLLGGASVSSDGQFVLFGSTASNLVASPSNGSNQLYVRIVVGNQAPVLSAGPDETVTEGAWLKRFGTFSDLDASTSWTATADFGSGAFPVQISANTKTWSFSHEPLPVGTYDVTISITDNEGATGADTFRHTVANVAPLLDLGDEAFLYFDERLYRPAGLGDPGSNWPVPQPAETYNATVDYGDGTIATFSTSHFSLDHTYSQPGTYVVKVTSSDSNGGSTSGSLTVHVLGYRFAWVGLGDAFVVGRNLPVKFTVRAPDGSFVLDRSVQVAVVDAANTYMAGPYTFGDQPSRSVTLSGDSYHVNVDTRALQPGMYWLRVRFSSPTLVGEFTLATNGTASALRSGHRD